MKTREVLEDKKNIDGIIWPEEDWEKGNVYTKHRVNKTLNFF